MLTFTQFLAEKFFDSFESPWGYTEIFLNPSMGEFGSIAKDFASDYDQIGVIISKGKTYAWNRQNATHEQVRRQLGISDPQWLPLYIYYRPSQPSKMRVQVSDFSSGEYWEGKTARQITAFLKTHPIFKKYTVSIV